METSHIQRLTLPAIVDLDALDNMREQLLDALSAGPVDIGADGVERVSTNALFMLLSAAETARQSGEALSISGASEIVVAAIGRLGLDTAFAPILKE